MTIGKKVYLFCRILYDSRRSPQPTSQLNAGLRLRVFAVWGLIITFRLAMSALTTGNDDFDELIPSLFLAISVASVVTMLFLIWFLNRFVNLRPDVPVTTRSLDADMITSLVADNRAQKAVIDQQRLAVDRLEARCADLEVAFRELRSRLGDGPNVPTAYQATTPSPRGLRYSGSQREL
jgi:hypothetical protein